MGDRPTRRPIAYRRAPKVLRRQSKVFKDDPKRADELLSVGESADEKLDPYDHAAWTLLASIILNLDETLNRE